jgi:hypothetical protein
MTEYRALLERTGEQVQPKEDAFERLVRARDSRNRNRRVLTGLLAIVVATCGTLAAFMAFSGSGSPSPADATTPQTYHDERGGWSIRYPAGWFQSRIDEGLRVHARGIRISNYDITLPSPVPSAGSVSIPDMEFLRAFPHDGVLVQMWQLFGGPMIPPERRDSRFPITLEDLKPLDDSYTGGSEPLPLYGFSSGNGEIYQVAVWIGPDVSAADRQAAADVVRSWQFLPLTDGTVIGRSVRFHVLGAPNDYPIGTAIRFGRSSFDFPFYLVHVEDGFFALAWPNDQSNGYKDCDVRYEADRRAFSCPNGARWDLRGNVLEKPGPGFPNDPLSVLLVRISLDGHVLVSPNLFGSDTKQDLELT